MSQTSRRGRPRHPDVLTPAEWRIVHAVRHGLTNRGIAERFGISVDAVKFHIENTAAKLSLGGRSALKQWRGAPRCSALFLKEAVVAESVALRLGPIGQVSRQVRDIQQAEAWYRDVLGLPHLYTFGNLAFFDCGGVRLYLTQDTSEGSAGNSVLYFRVDDINAAHAGLVERGVTFRGAPHLIHRHADGMEEWMAFFDDPDGNILALMAQIKPKQD